MPIKRVDVFIVQRDGTLHVRVRLALGHFLKNLYRVFYYKKKLHSLETFIIRELFHPSFGTEKFYFTSFLTSVKRNSTLRLEDWHCKMHRYYKYIILINILFIFRILSADRHFEICLPTVMSIRITPSGST